MSARHHHNDTLDRLRDLVIDTDCRLRQLGIRLHRVCDRLTEAFDESAGTAEDGWLRAK